MSHSIQLEYCNITIKPLYRRPSQAEFDVPLLLPLATVPSDMEFIKLHLNCTGLMSASSKNII